MHFEVTYHHSDRKQLDEDALLLSSSSGASEGCQESEDVSHEGASEWRFVTNNL